MSATQPNENPDQHTADAALIARIQRDDEQALTELTTKYALRLAILAASLLDSNTTAEDIVQDVFIDLWERRATLDISTNVAGYLYRAVRYRSISHRRRERAAERLGETLRADTDAQVSYNIAEQRIEDADVLNALQTALANVSPSPRRVFLLNWSGLSYQEIAETLGITQQSVRQQIYRATQRLAQLLQRREK